MKKQALGRGLGALIDTEDIRTSGSSSINEILISDIEPNPDQPRTFFDDERIVELAQSIKEIGIVSPITLRQMNDGKYQIIAGERRYRAAKSIGLERLPAYVTTVGDDQVLEMALVENIQREDLSAIEIALSYQKMMEIYNVTQDQLSERVGKKRATIANYVRLLKLPSEIQLALKDRKIDMGHARALAGLESPIHQIEVFHIIMESGCSVRQTEEIVQSYNNNSEENEEVPVKPKKSKGNLDIDSETKIKSLESKLGKKVKVSVSANGSIKLAINCANNEDLMELLEKVL